MPVPASAGRASPGPSVRPARVRRPAPVRVERTGPPVIESPAPRPRDARAMFEVARARSRSELEEDGLLARPVTAAELLDPSRGVHDLLLPGVERVARGADFHVKIAVMGRSGRERVAARTGDRDLFVPGMNVRLHAPEGLGSMEGRAILTQLACFTNIQRVGAEDRRDRFEASRLRVNPRPSMSAAASYVSFLEPPCTLDSYAKLGARQEDWLRTSTLPPSRSVIPRAVPARSRRGFH